MTRKMTIGDKEIIVIEAESEQICSYCGEMHECRPYGVGGAQICFGCGMKDEETTDKEFDKFVGVDSE